MAMYKVNGFTKWSNVISEDIAPGAIPDEITYKGYTTKNLHHSEDARRAFVSTIQRAQEGKIHDDSHAILHALKATDTYMKINDLHLSQGAKAPDEKELAQWNQAHQDARKYLNHVGEFMHHMDYWHNHEHEIQDLMGNFTPETAGAEMADSYEPQGDQLDEGLSANDLVKVKGRSGVHKVARVGELVHVKTVMGHDVGFFKPSDVTLHKKHTPSGPKKPVYASGETKFAPLKTEEFESVSEELTDKTIRSGDKIKVARVIADMLGVENAESMSPDIAINTGLRKLRTKRMTPELVGVLKKMLNLAQEVGIKVDMTLVPKAVSEQKVDTDSKYNSASDILRFNDFLKLHKLNNGIVPVEEKDPTEVGHSLHTDDNDQVRRMKVKYKTEEIEKEIVSADYKTDKQGRKYPAHRIVFKSGKEEEVQEEVEYDLSDEDLDGMANDVDDVDDVLDAYDDEELKIIDDETGEEVNEQVNEEALNEVLSRIERMRAKMRFLRTASKRERRLKIVLHRRSDAKTLNKRARRLALNMLKQRIMKKPVAQMSVAEKERVEKMLEKRKALVDRLAMRLTPRMRRIEADRLSHQKTSGPAPAPGM